MKEGLYIHVEDAVEVVQSHRSEESLLEEMKARASIYATEEAIVRRKE